MAKPDLRESVFAGVLLLANRMQTEYDSVLPEVTLKQWLALVVIAGFPPPVPSTSAVSQALGTSHQNVRKLVSVLETKGLLSLDPSPTDGRAREIRLTAAAHELFDREAQTGVRLLDELFAGVPAEDLRTCLNVLDSMSVNLTGTRIVSPAAR